MPRNKQVMPMCQYGGSCTRKGCVYRHPPPQPKKKHAPKTTEICVHYVSGACSFGDKCANRHPGKVEAQKFRETCASIACRFGERCMNPNCLYDHEGRGRVREVPAPAPAPPAVVTPVLPESERWWQEPGCFGDRDCDPISLEPLAELEYPPFGLCEAGVWHFFDGAVLATYLVSTATFCNPLTRTPLRRDDCRALDEYLADHGLRETIGDVLVVHTFDLLEMTARGESGVDAMVSRSQREATTVLRSLFGFARYEPPPEEDPNAAAYADSYAPRADAAAPDAAGASLADAIARHDDGAEALAPAPLGDILDGALPPPPALDASSFPALSALAMSCAQDDDGLPDLGGLSFAQQAAKPAAPVSPPYAAPAPAAAPRQSARSVRVPQEIWVPLRNARVFEISDPLERYRLVAAAHERRDVVDLHFQSSRTAPVVLRQVLDASLRANPAGVWVVTGSGHHAPQQSHQQKKASLFHFVGDWLESQGYASQIAKDHNGFAGAYLVQGPPRGAPVAAPPGPYVPYRTGGHRVSAATFAASPLDWNGGGAATVPSAGASWGAPAAVGGATWGAPTGFPGGAPF